MLLTRKVVQMRTCQVTLHSNVLIPLTLRYWYTEFHALATDDQVMR